MEYSIRELSQLAGVSARTLRYYDQIGLLKPAYVQATGYRFYGEAEVGLLQQILFYRERGLGLEQIAGILYEKDFDAEAALEEHLEALMAQQERTARLINTVKKTIASMKGENKMKDSEKFEAFKQDLLAENEKKFGEEIRRKYGSDTVDASNRKMLHMSPADYEHFQRLDAELLEKLREAVTDGADPAGAAGKEIALLHRDWLRCTLPDYTPAIHRGIAEMYICDPRFTAYYDKEMDGCAVFLKDAVISWMQE